MEVYMQKYKGYTNDEITELASRVESAKQNNQKLSVVFEGFARDSGRAKGSVRNFYYELVRAINQSEVACDKYFTKTPFVNKIQTFSDSETRMLIKKILLGKKQNKSVRRTISELTGGDDRLSLRYQNKYRNVLKSSPELIEEIAEEIGLEDALYYKHPYKKVPDISLKQLKISIDELVKGIADGAKRENENLKKTNDELKKENAVLRGMLKKFLCGRNSGELLEIGMKDRKIN